MEGDLGPISGWTYTVNGKSPSIGCDAYAVKDGDVIAWVFVSDLSGLFEVET